MIGSVGAQGSWALRTERLSKTYPGTAALSNVDLEVGRGEILGLLGGNGSGKSTLIKVLAGVERGDPGGRISVPGLSHSADRWGPADARAAHLRFVHQSLGLFGELSIAENLAIGRGFERRGPAIDWSATHANAERVLTRFQVDADPSAAVGGLRPAERTMVAIARALQDQEEASRSVLFLDEPSASLPAGEVALLHEALRRYRNAGQTIIYVSHRLDEVMQLTDRVAVLRDGHLVAVSETVSTDERSLISIITGGVDEGRRAGRADQIVNNPIRLEARALTIGALRQIDFHARSGEVVGVAGLLGSGRTSLLRAMFGDRPASGSIHIDGRCRRFRTSRDAMRSGVAYVPEDRARDGAFAGMSVGANLSAAVVPSYWSRCHLRRRSERDDARALMGVYTIRAHSQASPIEQLSGGNQQKVMVARWIRRIPSVLLLDEPTQGVDVGARADIHRMLRELADRGTAIVVVSSDFVELGSLCDRVVVLRGGRVVASLDAADVTADELNRLAHFDSTDPVDPEVAS